MPPRNWIKLTYADVSDPWYRRLLIEAVEFATGRRLIERLYNEIRDAGVPATQLWGLALKQLQIDLRFDAHQLGKVPEEGPLIFIANHPFGVVDGLILGHLLSMVRSDYFLLVNEVLTRDERLAPFLLPIDFRETKAALQTNIESRQEAIHRLRAGEALGIFPAGGVATSRTWWGPAEDLEWKRFVVKLIQQSQATVVPLFFQGQNSRLFQLASQFSMPLRLGLLLQETRNKMGKQVMVRIGDPINPADLENLRDRSQWLEYLRSKTFALGTSSPAHSPGGS